MKPKISIIIPCYNQSFFLEETIQSVLNQSYKNWECIIIDDGSTDGSKEVALKWCNLDKRFQYSFKVNGGLSSARNLGLKLAKGYYIQFLDADDLIKPNKFEEQLKDLECAQISISDYFSFVDGNLELVAKNRYLSPFFSEMNYKKDIILDWEFRRSIPCHAVLFEKSLLNNNNILFDEILQNHEDWVFWVKIFYNATAIKNNPNILAFYRIRDKSMSTDYKLMREGFVLASKCLIDYFVKLNDREYTVFAKSKLRQISKKNRKIDAKRFQILNKIKRFGRKLSAKLIQIIKYSKLKKI